MNDRIHYRINDWDDNFESAKSRTINNKSWGVYPLKQGSGYCRLMMSDNGAMVYGCFMAMVSIAHSKPKETRRGYLTDTGGIPGYPYDILDISAMTRIPEDKMVEAVNQLLKIKWISACDSTGKSLEGYHEDTTRIPQHPYTERTEDTKGTEPDYETADEIIDYLNEKTNSHFKHSKTSRENIHARLSEGYAVEDLKRVIDHRSVVWNSRVSKKPETEDWLNPTTLFRPSKIEKNINAAMKWEPKEEVKMDYPVVN